MTTRYGAASWHTPRAGSTNSVHRTFRISALSVLISVAGFGCAVGPNYNEPAPNLVPFHNHTVEKGETALRLAPPLDQWWTGFNDSELVTVVQRALSENLDLAAAFARVTQARAAASGAGATLLPTVDATAGASAERTSLYSPFGAIESAFPNFNRSYQEYTVGAAASWEIDVAGGLRRGAAAARNEAQAAEADQMGTRVTVVADTADAYLQIRGFQARLAVAQDQIDTDQHLLSLIRVRHRLGASDDREVAQAEALLKQATATIPTLRISLEAQLNRLDVLMGAQPGTYATELATSSPIPSIPFIDDSDTPLNVLRRRPDIIAAERRLAASNERIGAALADYYPRFSLSGVVGFDSISTGHLFSEKAFQPIGSGAIRWRLFDFGKIKAEVAQARGANREALAQYQLAALRATEDVENAIISLFQSELKVLELQDEVASLLRARDLSQKSYEAGAITLTDVLDADRQLLFARDDLDATRTDAARAAVRTFRAMGGGWETGHDARSAGIRDPEAD